MLPLTIRHVPWLTSAIGRCFLTVPLIGGTNECSHLPVGNLSTYSSVRQSPVVFLDLSGFTYLTEKHSLNYLPCCLIGNLNSCRGTAGE